jgi:hypothetical protein
VVVGGWSSGDVGVVLGSGRVRVGLGNGAVPVGWARASNIALETIMELITRYGDTGLGRS